MQNKYLEILLNNFQDETTANINKQLLLVNDKDQLNEILNIATVLSESQDSLRILWQEYERLNNN